MRASTAASPVPRVMAGRIRLDQPSRPLTGVQPSHRENPRISMGPSQKLGMAAPSREKPMTALSRVLPRSLGGDHPQWDGDDQGEQQRRRRQLQGRPETLADQIRHRPLGLERIPQIEACESGEEIQILGPERPIETQGRPQRPPIGRTRPLPQHRLDGIAGHQVDQQEDQGGDPEDGQRRAGETGDEEPQHLSPRRTPARPRCRSGPARTGSASRRCACGYNHGNRGPPWARCPGNRGCR